MDILLIVDMQEGLRLGPPKHDLDGVIARINALAQRVRARQGHVIAVRHVGSTGDPFAPGAPGAAFLHGLALREGDIVIEKRLNDAFHGTDLEATLRRFGAVRVMICGWATDFCVDATIRSAAALGFPVVAVTDCHTLADRPHLAAPAVMTHHHHIWAGLIAPHQVRLATSLQL